MSFKQFLLSEAVFNASKFDRVLTLLEKVLAKRIGPVYRYGGDGGSVALQSSSGTGMGILYTYRAQSAFRLNYVRDGSSFRFASVDIWLKFGLKNFVKNIIPDFQVQIPEEVNIVQIADNLGSILASPGVGSEVFIVESADVELYESLLTEKQRVELPAFVDLARKDFPNKLTQMTLSDIKAVSDKYDVTIPSVIWGMKAGRGVWNLLGEVPTGTVTTDDGAKISTGKATDLLLITRGEDGKFYKMSPADLPSVPQGKEIVKQINSVMSSTTAKDVTPTHLLFQDLTDLVTLVATGKRPSLMIVGGPGIGKTFTVLQTIKDCGLKERTDFIIAKGKVTPAALYRTLFINYDKLIVFDDTDSIWRDEDAVNILKAALDSYDIRTVTWFSNQTTNLSSFSRDEADHYIKRTRNALIDDPQANVKLPNEFNFTGQIIFISNLAKNRLDTAVMSRSLTIDMTLTQEQVLERMQSILQYLGPKDQSMDEKLEVFNFFKDEVLGGNASSFGEVNMRTLIAGMDIRSSGNPNWKRLIKYI